MLDPRLEPGAIIGIAVGIVVVIVAIAAVAFFLVRRKNRYNSICFISWPLPWCKKSTTSQMVFIFIQEGTQLITYIEVYRNLPIWTGGVCCLALETFLFKDQRSAAMVPQSMQCRLIRQQLPTTLQVTKTKRRRQPELITRPLEDNRTKRTLKLIPNSRQL